jgi:peroxiredoxin family protein
VYSFLNIRLPVQLRSSFHYIAAMKKIAIAAAILFASYSSFAQTELPVDSVSSAIGQDVKVCATFYGMKETDKITLINVGAAYPNSPLTIVIYAKDKDKFKSIIKTFEKEKTSLCVSGTVSEFKGKTQIAVERPEQLQAGK